MINLKITSDTLDEVDASLALVLAFQDVRPLRGQVGLLDWRLNGALSQFIMDHKFSGSYGESLLLPSMGRVLPQELLVLGLGNFKMLSDQMTGKIISMLIDKLTRKKNSSFCLSLSDLSHSMFEWRNTVRLFISMLSGREEAYQVALIEPEEFVADARKRHMDFSYDVKVQYS